MKDGIQSEVKDGLQSEHEGRSSGANVQIGTDTLTEGNASHPRDDLPSDLGMKKQNNPSLRNACFALPWSQQICDRWFSDLLVAIASPSDSFMPDEETAVVLLERFPPKGADKNLPAKWLERVEKEVGDNPAAEQARLDALLRKQDAALEADRLARLDAWYAEHPEEARA